LARQKGEATDETMGEGPENPSMDIDARANHTDPADPYRTPDTRVVVHRSHSYNSNLIIQFHIAVDFL